MKALNIIPYATSFQSQVIDLSVKAWSPDHQRRGIARTLMEFAEQRIRASGMKMVMVETTGDSGHAPARLTYEASGYERWPVARYFKRL
ncbi:MAG: GNAT family N-acetyltransferase [Hyphomicrobiales bacterium]|nr:GNAT family N-acetyltransferase [Hyphomicrobiales bacterium]